MSLGLLIVILSSHVYIFGRIMTQHPFYIITGPPSSGKTTLINSLQDLNYKCHPEMARLVIQNNIKNGVDCFPWNNTLDFSHQVFLEVSNLLSSINTDFSFFDRSLVDIIAYMDISKISRNKKYIEAIKQSNYNRNVFFLPFWDNIYTIDLQRRESKEEAKLIENNLRLIYNELGFNLIDVPMSALKERVDFIIKTVQSF